MTLIHDSSRMTSRGVPKRLVMFDFLNVFYRAFHANAGLSFAGEFTGALYGFTNQFAATINELNPASIAVCRDSHPYLRSSECPQYKSNRRAMSDRGPDRARDAARSRNLCAEFLQLLGVGIVERPGLEADDLIAAMVRMGHVDGQFDELIAATNDSDLYQLFTVPGFKLYRGRKKGFYGAEDFARDYEGMAPGDWVRVTALAGGHNGLPGIKGIGEKTAFMAVRGEVSDSKRELIAKNKTQVQLNEKLARLPFYRFRNWYEIEVPALGPYSERDMIKFLSKRGIRFTASMKNAFDRIHGN